MKFLITGITGFVGSQVARFLVMQGHSIRAPILEGDDVSRIVDIQGSIEFFKRDLFFASDSEIAALCDSIDLCIHLAWYAEPGKYLSAPENIDCLRGSLRLLNELGRAGCRRTIAAGTCFEYDFDFGYLSESTPTKPTSLYAATKSSAFLIGEQIARLFCMQFAWARLFYLYGPHEDKRRLVASLITSLMRNEDINVTRGLQVRDFLHVEDAASAVVEVALSDIIGPVNIGSGVPVTIRKIVLFIAESLGRSELVHFGVRPDNPTDPPFICANNRKLVEGTHWSPKYMLEEGLKHTIKWWESQIHIM